MNLEFLKNEIAPQRASEIKDGKNLSTRNPIYLVIDIKEQYIGGHIDDDYSFQSKYSHLTPKYGYIDEESDWECREFCDSDIDMVAPVEVTEVYTEHPVAFFLTSKAAHEYCEYQKHNLNKPFVYVAHAGYSNHQMEQFLND